MISWFRRWRKLPPIEFVEEHLPECDPTNCDISGEDCIVRAFVQEVAREIAKGEICIMYEQVLLSSSSRNSGKIWPAMKEESFRTKASRQRPRGKFLAPDEYDEWTFVEYPPSASSKGGIG